MYRARLPKCLPHVYAAHVPMMDTQPTMPTPLLDPRTYQQEGALWLQQTRRGLLADSQGLGKTATALLAAYKHTPTLIIAPAFWTNHWYSFIRSALPTASILNAGTGTKTDRLTCIQVAHQMLRSPNPTPNYMIVSAEMLSHYGTLLTHLSSAFQSVIIDEAHMFRSRTAKRVHTAKQLTKHTPYLYLLTATPVMTDVDDFWQLLNLLAPRQFTSYYQFIDAHCRTTKLAYKISIDGLRNPAEFATMLRRYMLKRTYTEVARQLPPTLPTTIIPFDLTDELRREYKSVRDDYISNGLPLASAGAVMHTLRAITARQKAPIIADLLAQEEAPLQPYIIFTWYKETAHAISYAIKATLPAGATPPIVVTGDTPAADRTRIALQNPYIIATIASMSVGVDLSHHKLIIFAEEDYTPGTMDQALTRVIRDTLDHSRPVRPYVLRARRTIDNTIARVYGKRGLSVYAIMQEMAREKE